MLPTRVCDRLRVVSLAVVLITLVFPGCDEGGAIRSIREFVVEISTQTGEWVVTNATTVAETFRLAWDELMRREEDGVLVDRNDPLSGMLNGVYHLKVIHRGPEGRKSMVDVILENPPMRRDSPDGRWRLDESFREELGLLNEDSESTENP